MIPDEGRGGGGREWLITVSFSTGSHPSLVAPAFRYFHCQSTLEGDQGTF